MSLIQRSNFQGHPFHLVSPSPWPLLTCTSLLTLTTTTVLNMHGFEQSGVWLLLSLVSLIASMSFWFRDVISEGRANSILLHINGTLNIARAICAEEVKQSLDSYYASSHNKTGNHYNDNENLGYYLAGLL